MKLNSQMDQATEAAFTPPKDQGHSKAVVEWASRINSVWAHGTTSTLELSKVVYAARRKLLYGEWARRWDSRCVAFSKRKAEMLVVIGRNLDNLDAQTSAHLPPGWNTLYHLALLERTTLGNEEKAGTIHSGMTLRAAKELLAKSRGQSVGHRSRKLNVKQRLQKFADFICSTLPDWSPEERELAEAEFVLLADQVRAQGEPQSFRPGHSAHRRPSTTVSFPT